MKKTLLILSVLLLGQNAAVFGGTPGHNSGGIHGSGKVQSSKELQRRENLDDAEKDLYFKGKKFADEKFIQELAQYRRFKKNFKKKHPKAVDYIDEKFEDLKHMSKIDKWKKYRKLEKKYRNFKKNHENAPDLVDSKEAKKIWAKLDQKEYVTPYGKTKIKRGSLGSLAPSGGSSAGGDTNTPQYAMGGNPPPRSYVENMRTEDGPKLIGEGWGSQDRSAAYEKGEGLAKNTATDLDGNPKAVEKDAKREVIREVIGHDSQIPVSSDNNDYSGPGGVLPRQDRGKGGQNSGEPSTPPIGYISSGPTIPPENPGTKQVVHTSGADVTPVSMGTAVPLGR